MESRRRDVEVIEVPAGAWIRDRSLPTPPTRRQRVPALEPEWRGLWHASTGDRRFSPAWHLGHGPNVVARCGRQLEAAVSRRLGDGAAYRDLIVAESVPAVDLCRRCASLAGVTLPERGREDWRARAAARIVQDTTLGDAECRSRLRMLLGAVAPAVRT